MRRHKIGSSGKKLNLLPLLVCYIINFDKIQLNPLYSGSTTLFSKEGFTKTSKELSDVHFLMRKDYLSSALTFIPLNP